ncbi:MAG: hypothetical protein NZ895_03165 [Archaeoglobaceae archaeon]|nr:hypothetical protein [Archaeoglobaceae archaeon]MCX8152121.1 hypothetical protein [Archaeoglobaceae archaeon]MDW8013557.1 hypothetical protein [Archaeoglobaceae archaeon]
MESEIIEKVSKILESRKVTTREEVVRIVLRVAFDVLGYKIDDFCEKFDEISCSFIDLPISIKNLHFSDELEIDGIKFYRLHTVFPSKKDIEIAHEEFLKSKKLLDNLETMRKVTDKFFKGYNGYGKFFRVYSGKSKYGVFYSIIDDLYEDFETHRKISKSFDGEYVVCVVTERKVEPFLKFFRSMSEKIKRTGIKVWVIDPESESLDPFIGYPKDLELIKGFRNPKIASIINSLWRVNVEKVD